MGGPGDDQQGENARDGDADSDRSFFGSLLDFSNDDGAGAGADGASGASTSTGASSMTVSERIFGNANASEEQQQQQQRKNQPEESSVIDSILQRFS